MTETSIRKLLYLAGVVLLGTLTWLTLTARSKLDVASSDEHAISAKIGLDADEAHRLILEAGLTAMEARKASAEERADLATQNAAVTQLIRSLNGTVNSVRDNQDAISAQGVRALQTAQVAIGGLVPVEKHLDAETVELATATKSANVLLSDPNIKGTTAHLDGAAANVEAMSADAREKVHSVLHPKLWTKVVDVAERVAVDVGKCVF